MQFENIKINYYKCTTLYLDYLLSLGFKEQNIIKFDNEKDLYNAVGINIYNTPKLYYNLKYLLNLIAQFKKIDDLDVLKIVDFSSRKLDKKSEFIDTLFNVPISFNFKENAYSKIEKVYFAGVQDRFKRKEKFLFLDRDGVINFDCKYPSKPEDIVVCDDIVDIMNYFLSLDYKIVVVSNQSGISREIFDYRDLFLMENKITNYLQQFNIEIFDWLYCPYYKHKDKSNEQNKFDKNSYLRKPFPGMLLNFMHDNPCELEKSLMIGDKASDDLNLLGLRTFFIKGKYEIKANSKNKDKVFNSHCELLLALKETFSKACSQT